MENSDHSSKRTNSVRLGVSPLSWVNEVLEDLGRGTDANTCLREAAAAGFAGVEFSRIFPRDAQSLTRLLSSHGLDFVSGWHSGFLADRDVAEELEAVGPHACLLRDSGATVMVYGECGRMADNALDVPMSHRLMLQASEIAAYGDRLTRFADAVKAEYGLSLAYHHHLMMVAETFDEIEAVMAATGPSVGLLLDTGHAAAAGFDYTCLIEAFGPRINHIHLKDVRRDVLGDVRRRNLSFNEGVRAGMFTVPGDGMVDYAALASFIASGRYSGWMVVEAEQDPSIAPPAKTVARAFCFVSETIMQTRGLKPARREEIL